jgi:Ankyrin repeats (3 copies)
MPISTKRPKEQDPNAFPSQGAKNSKGNTPLIAAAVAGETETVRQLLATEADVNKANNDRDTALIAAVEAGHLDIVQLLLAAVETDINVERTNVLEELLRRCPDNKYTQGIIKNFVIAHIKGYVFKKPPNGRVNPLLLSKASSDLQLAIRLYVDGLDDKQLLICTQLLHRTQTGITNPEDIDNLNEMGKLVKQAPGRHNLPKTIAGAVLAFVGMALLIGSYLIACFASGGVPLAFLFGLFFAGLVGAHIGLYVIETGQEKDFSIARAACNFWKTLTLETQAADQKPGGDLLPASTSQKAAAKAFK